jgi:hypothetical protein
MYRSKPPLKSGGFVVGDEKNGRLSNKRPTNVQFLSKSVDDGLAAF